MPSVPVKKILEIGNHPPPFCGWATHTRFVVEEIRRRGAECHVLKINENRRIKSPEYVDVQNGWDYLAKVVRYAAKGYSINVHINAESRKGFLLALSAVSIGRLFRVRSTINFHGGVPQSYFPLGRSSHWHWGFKLLFSLAHSILCNSNEIALPIQSYGVPAAKICTAAGFSFRNLEHKTVELNQEVTSFLTAHSPVFFCYLSFRPEYRLAVLREGMAFFRKTNSKAGYIWLGFPEKEMGAAREYIGTWRQDEKESVLLLGNLSHDEFVTLLLRCTAKLRTPACDGVSASVLESLALGVPVVASENGRRPPGVVTYAEMDPVEMAEKLAYVVSHYAEVKDATRVESSQDNVARTADWLLGDYLAGEHHAGAQQSHSKDETQSAAAVR